MICSKRKETRHRQIRLKINKIKIKNKVTRHKTNET
jgi:hypothetical protein